MTEGFLPKAYTARDAADTRKLYDNWATSYETEVADNGYATPARCAAALAKYMPDQSLPVLDFGCGTGLSGMALKHAGFTTLDGMDLSEEMLTKAQGKSIYRNTLLIEPNTQLSLQTGTYAAIAAIGVIGAGAAPISVFDSLMSALDRGGFLVWSFNDRALEDRSNEAKLNEYLDLGAARLLCREYGPHLPKINMGSNVYVLEKT